MKSSNRTLCAAAVAALCGIAPAAAQTPEQAIDTEIVVEAPRAVAPPQAERGAFTGAPIITTTVRMSALYGDLDLTQPTHAARLMTRIERVAHDACRYLDRLHPLNPDPDCVGRAVANATPAAKATIAAAAAQK